MQKTALVIMAAGIGSRFGKGIKQLASVGPCGEIIMDYSIYDAVQAGFGKEPFHDFFHGVIRAQDGRRVSQSDRRAY